MLETVFIGLTAALLFTELTGFTPGGIIVPAYLALSLDRPERLAATLAAALLTLGAYKLLAGRLLLFGRRRFVLMLLLGGLLSQAGALLLPQVSILPLEARIIGWVIPGLLANNLERQKPLPTLAACVTVTVFTWFAARLAGLL
ncbi:MAG: poly-gamma-glutamate biosynthesis protein PgsC [Candidatus Aminicenantes bacterium]|nr:poly-gamma-glutamate biosynthesis protein PgsC [Candidatus Aminicenantes bacterium]